MPSGPSPGHGGSSTRSRLRAEQYKIITIEQYLSGLDRAVPVGKRAGLHLKSENCRRLVDRPATKVRHRALPHGTVLFKRPNQAIARGERLSKSPEQDRREMTIGVQYQHALEIVTESVERDLCIGLGIKHSQAPDSRHLSCKPQLRLSRFRKIHVVPLGESGGPVGTKHARKQH
jgi:hypothetical protein